MPAEQEKLHTVDEFYEMYDETNERIELIDGRVIMQAAPSLTYELSVKKAVNKKTGRKIKFFPKNY